MGTPSETYVDPAIAGDSGTGTIGDPYGDIQFALDSMTRDVTDGDRLNIKAGTDEILAATLSFTAYGTPAINQPLIFQGYTTIAGDGGIGGIDGDGSFSIITTATIDYLIFIDLHLHNSGLNDVVVNVDNFCHFFNCEIDGGKTGINMDEGGSVISCYIHNCTGTGVDTRGSALVFNYFKNGANKFSNAILSNNAEISFNIIDIDSSSDGIIYASAFSTGYIVNNSIFSVNSTRVGIQSSGPARNIVLNNIVEGFSGVGGRGIELFSGGNMSVIGYNAYFNNTTNFTNNGDIVNNLTANDQILDASAFVDAANGDFRVKISVKALAYPTTNFPNLSVRTFLDIGALQRLEGAVVIVPPVGVSLGRLYNVPAEDRIYEVLL